MTNKYKYLSNKFLEPYKHMNPFKTQLGEITYIRTYSQYLQEEQRREFWWETVARAVDYSIGLANGLDTEAEKLFDNIFNLRQFTSGRTLWTGGSEISKKYAMANFNCAGVVVDEVSIFHEIFYLLLIGSGVGFRAIDSDVKKLPAFRQDLKIMSEYYEMVNPKDRQEVTALNIDDDSATIIIGDSKEGWTQSLQMYMQLLTDRSYRTIKNVRFNFNNVRPKGERLKQFGGFASGHESLQAMFRKIYKIILSNQHGGKLTTTNVIDICNIIGESVVSGGVRRTAEIAVIAPDDDESINMKNDLYTQVDDEWVINQDLLHRQMSNNSIYYEEKPTRERLHWQIEKMRYSGEPAFINAEYAKTRRENFNIVNPCSEVLLDSRGTCNLTEINVMAFVNDGKIDYDELFTAQALSVRVGLRMTLPTFELSKWDVVAKRDRLLGASITGWQDMVNATKLNRRDEAILLTELREIAHSEAKSYADELGINEPILITTVKPSGTLSLLPTVSSGIHYSHSHYYIRRVRMSIDDPLAKTMMELGFNWNPEVGEEIETMKTIVVDFPVEAPEGTTKNDVSAIQQLENYILFMENYVDHNVSITVTVRDYEWDMVEEYIWEHWDKILGISFIPLSDAFYKLMPYEEITKDEYVKLLHSTPMFDRDVLNRLENGEDLEFDDSACENGICPIK